MRVAEETSAEVKAALIRMMAAGSPLQCRTGGNERKENKQTRREEGKQSIDRP